MRIITCHISGFGRFSNKDCDFTSGFNAWLEDNGWGKTTLSIFIKAMFFGMDYNVRKKELLEREHYRPWDGGPYGGSLSFALNDRKYRIERSFGKKEKEDTFALYDEATGLLSDDYTVNIGEEIFHVDRDAFEKSIFIPQGAPAAEKSDSINAKMGDLTTARDDINNFDEAIRRLEDAKAEYTRRGAVNPGKLVQVKKEIQDCREAADRLPALSDGIEKQRQMLEVKKGQLAKLEKQKEDLSGRISEQSRREQELGAYLEKKNAFAKLVEAEKDLRTFFNEKEPSSEEIEVYDEMERRLEMNRNARVKAAEELPEPAEAEKLNRLFKERDISSETLETFAEQAERILNLRIQGEHSAMPEDDREHLTELKVFFNKHYPSEDELEMAQGDASDLMQVEGQVKTLGEVYRSLLVKKENYEEKKEESGPSPFIFVLASALVFAAGGVLLFVGSGQVGRLAGMGCFLFAVILIAGALTIKNRKQEYARQHDEEEEREVSDAKRELEEKEEERRQIQSRLEGFLSHYLFSPTDNYMQMVGEVQRKLDLYERLKHREEEYTARSSGTLEELSALQVQLYTALTPYADIYGLGLYDEHMETEVIQRLKEDLLTWKAWKNDEKKMQEFRNDEIELRSEIEEFLSRYYRAEGKELKEKLANVRKRADSLRMTREQILKLKEELNEREAVGLTDGEVLSVEKLQEGQRQTDAVITELLNQIVKDKEHLSDLTDDFEKQEEKSEALPELREREEGYRRKVDTYEKTIQYLKLAREKFLAAYMGPLRNALRKYLGKVTKDGANLKAEDFTLDMDLKVALRYNGGTREREYLSAGYRDLTAVCSRLALMDVLYREEMPPLILDDPFANLDDRKAVEALRMITEISLERQVIYFTCHPDRMPEGVSAS